jgi:hypothetical protein
MNFYVAYAHKNSVELDSADGASHSKRMPLEGLVTSMHPAVMC